MVWKFLLKNIPPSNSVRIMDNTPYHSVIKDKVWTMASKKGRSDWMLKQQNSTDRGREKGWVDGISGAQ